MGLLGSCVNRTLEERGKQIGWAEGKMEGPHCDNKGLSQPRGELWGWNGLSGLFQMEAKGPSLYAPTQPVFGGCYP